MVSDVIDRVASLVGLLDESSHDEIVVDIVAVTGLIRDEALEKITAESFNLGSNVVTDARDIDDERPFVFKKSSEDVSSRISTIPRRNTFELAMRKIAFTLLQRYK